MTLEDEAGYYAVMLPEKNSEYRFQVTRGSMQLFFDAYEYPCQITEEAVKEHFVQAFIIKPIRNLVHIRLSVEVCVELIFTVWAPNAIRVSIVGDFDRWDGRRLPMHRMPMSGIFELFVPGVKAGASYQYEIKIKGLYSASQILTETGCRRLRL